MAKVLPMQIGDDDDDDDDESERDRQVVGGGTNPRQRRFVGPSGQHQFSMRNGADDFEALEQEVERELKSLDPFVDEGPIPTPAADGPLRDDEDIVVDGFLSHLPQYHESLVAKKLQLYEGQLKIRERQIQRLQILHRQAEHTIQKLQHEVSQQRKAFEAAEAEWEAEKENVLRLRAGHGAGGSNNMVLFQMKMGSSAAALAAKNSSRDVESQKQRELRLRLIQGAADAHDQIDEPESLTAFAHHKFANVTWMRMKTFMRHRFYPFATDVRQIEARFGYSVASYFRFFRWVIMTFLAASAPSLLQLVLHSLTLVDISRTQTVDWKTYVGVFPRFLLIAGFVSSEAAAYSMVLMFIQLTVILFTLRKWVTEDQIAKRTESAESGSAQPRFGRVILNAWDFSVLSHEQADDLKRAITEQIKVSMEEEKLEDLLKIRTKREWYTLYARRFLAFVVYVVVQASSWYIIIVLTTQSSNIQAWISLRAANFAPYSGNLIPAAVTAINSVLPAVVSLLTRLEKWDDVGFSIKAMMIRLYLAKILNVVIQLVSYTLLLDPYLLTARTSIMDLLEFDGGNVRRNVMLPFKQDVYVCRAEQVASGLLTLVMTDFAVGKVAAIASPLLAWLVQMAIAFVKTTRTHRLTSVVPVETEAADPVRHEQFALEQNDSRHPSHTQDQGIASSKRNSTSKKISKVPAARTPMPKAEFQVPQKMVALLYSCTIALVAIPLAPAATILALILHIVNFKFDKIILMIFQKKPATPWSAKDAGVFFIKFYFCTVTIFFVFTNFFLGSTRLPKECPLQDLELVETSGSDAFTSMCVQGSYNSRTELCDLNVSHPSAAYFLDTAHPKRECLAGYPKCVCTSPMACGPFVAYSSGYKPVIDKIVAIRFVATVYHVAATRPLVVWAVALLFMLAYFFLRNSLRIEMELSIARQHDTAITFTALRRKIKQLETRARLHNLGGTEDKSGGNDGENTSKDQ